MTDVEVRSSSTGAVPAGTGATADKQATRRRLPVTRPCVLVLVVGLIVTGALSWLCYTVNDHNENRLLELQARQTGALLQVILPAIETPLASGAEIAATSHGDTGDFTSYISSYVGPKGEFVSASLWQVGGASPSRLATVGDSPELAAEPAKASSFLSRAARTPQLSVIGPIGTTHPRLGFAYASSGTSPTYAVYGELALPANRRATVQKGSPFADLRFALYLGRSTSSSMLLETNVAHLPISGRTSTVTVPFGTSALTLVATSQGHLGGAVSAWLWWIVAILGSLLAVVGALTAERLTRRRRAAERLTGEVRHLLGEQRTIAESLQHALLPQAMPAVPGVEFAVRYLPGVNGVEIGGDWYDVVPAGAGRFYFVIGDVSGRGVSAGSVMASLHFAIRGFVSEGHPPAVILDKLARLLNVSRDKHFATVLCGLADVDRHEITIANAGHPPPLLVADQRGEFVSTRVGRPIGVSADDAYQPVTITVPPRATLVAYTDGLIERRGESLDDGMARLRATAAGTSASLEELLTTFVTDLAHDGFDDDTAILGVRWLE